MDVTGALRMRLSKGPLFAALLTTCLGACGCSFLIDVDGTQCQTDSECVQRSLGATCSAGVCISSQSIAPGGACGAATCAPTETCFRAQCAATNLVEPFACERPAGNATPMVTLKLHVRDFLSNAPVAGLVVRACPVADVVCQTPIATVEDKTGTADVALNLPSGFAGFLELTSNATIETLFYYGKPLVSDLERTMTLVSSSGIDGLAALAAQANVTIDRTKGIAFAQTFDCNGKAAGGIHFEASKTANSFVVANGLPNLDAQLTVRDEAMNQAGGGFFNLEPGFAVFTARLGVNGPKVGEYNAQVRAAGITSLEFYP